MCTVHIQACIVVKVFSFKLSKTWHLYVSKDFFQLNMQNQNAILLKEHFVSRVYIYQKQKM